MSEDISAQAPSDDNSVQAIELEELRPLGTSPAGESFELVRGFVDDDALDDEELPPARFVLKKVTRARLRSPERFRQKFDALCRLDHPGLCPYRDLYVGEAATRITRDFVPGMPLDKFLTQPITDQESAALVRLSEESDAHPIIGSDVFDPDRDSTAEPSASKPSERELSDEINKNSELTTPSANHIASDSDLDAEILDEESEATPISGSHALVIEDEQQDEPEEEDYDSGRPSTLDIPLSLLEDSEAADRELDLIILRLRRIIPPLVQALEYLHRYRHAHGNLTPSNIIVTDGDQVVLTDFGLYPELMIPEASRHRYAAYHAPEIKDGNFDPVSDLYSLGAILFEALANRLYGTRRKIDTPTGAESGHSPVYLSEIVPHCPATWVDLIHGLLDSDPDDRPALEEVRQQLAASERRSVNIPASVIQDPEPLYGRHDSLEQLGDRAKWCSQNQTLSMAVVEGGTGVGKTALLDALARRAAQRGWVILHGRCYHREPTAYQGWEEIVDRLGDIADSLPEKHRKRLADDRRRASRIFPQLATEGTPPRVSRQAAVDGFRHFLLRLSEQRPLLICFDDAHWADRDSTRLLADLAERPSGLRLMVVATWHPNADDPDQKLPFWAELKTAPVDVDRIEMTGFSQTEAREYVLANAGNLSQVQKQKVLKRSGLNPLLIDEFIHEFDDTNELDANELEDPPEQEVEQSPEGDHSEEQQAQEQRDVNNRLRSFVENRLADLSRAQRLVLQLLAIASGPLSPDLLARAMSRELGTQTADIVSGHEVAESLVDRRLARRARRIEAAEDDEAQYVVVHDLCRRVILDELGQDHHSRLCGLIGDALAAGDTNADDLRFEYLLRAGRSQEASRAAVLAARTSADRFAYHRAARLWRWLIGHGEFEEQDRPDFADSLLGSGNYKEALEQIDTLVDDEPGDLARRRDRVIAHLSLGNRDQAVTAMDDAVTASSGAYCHRSIFERIGSLRRKTSATTARWSDATTVATDDPPDNAAQSRAGLYDFALQTAPFLLTQAYGHLEYRFAHIAAKSSFGPLLARDRLFMVGAPWLPFLIRDGNKIDRWTEQTSILAERFDDSAVQARIHEMSALIARHRGDSGSTTDHLTAASELLDSGTVPDQLLHGRVLHLQIDDALWHCDLETANRLVSRFFHHFRHHRWLSELAHLAAADRDLLTGNLDDAHHHIDSIETFVGEDRNCLLHMWMMSRRTSLNIARARPEVAVAEWDLLLDRSYSRSLQRLPQARLLINFNLARALASLAERQRALDESRRRETIGRLRQALRRLGDLAPWMGRYDRTTLLRLRARLAIIQDRSQRALRHVENVLSAAGDDSPLLLQALNQESLGVVLSTMERPNARATLEEARVIYENTGFYLPLVLEGWPVPLSHARLCEDP